MFPHSTVPRIPSLHYCASQEERRKTYEVQVVWIPCRLMLGLLFPLSDNSHLCLHKKHLLGTGKCIFPLSSTHTEVLHLQEIHRKATEGLAYLDLFPFHLSVVLLYFSGLSLQASILWHLRSPTKLGLPWCISKVFQNGNFLLVEGLCMNYKIWIRVVLG